MKNLYLLLFSLILVISLSACGANSTSTTDSSNPAEIDESESINADEDNSYVGTWSLISTTVDGEPVDSAATTLVLTRDTYSATTTCNVSGDLVIIEDLMTIIVNHNDCPTQVMQPGSSSVSSFKVSDDGEKLSISNNEYGVVVTEVYQAVYDDMNEMND